MSNGQKTLLFKDVAVGRDPVLKDTDKSALYAIAQAAVNVELFTIPLYMTSLYSLYGTHQITGKNNFYQGRLWPGKGTVANPVTPNDEAFNAIFSVFIAEMLHLQLASNICKVIGKKPTYISPALQTPNFGWKCYGPDITVLPHILDFKDTIAPYNEIKVKLGPVNKEQINLFLAIEETEDKAESIIREDVKKSKKYFPEVPFKNWTASSTEADLPMFGSIGAMYLCLWEYLSIGYSDNTTLWDYVFVPTNNDQQDIFNADTKNHAPEYPKMRATVDQTDPMQAQLEVLDMINGITDQGEGGGVVKMIKLRAGFLQQLNAVQQQFQPDPEALEKDYPSYTDTGKQKPSSDAAARVHFGSKDHYETFERVLELVTQGGIKTWDQWHAEGNKWDAGMLKTDGYDLNKYPLPTAEEIADALNNLKAKNPADNYEQLSRASAGAIAGVTTVLEKFWNQPPGPNNLFPYPSMSGSGDRMSICWAIFGKAPDLSIGIKPKDSSVLYHACQGMNLDPSQPADLNVCAAIEVYHTCKGSNTCRAEGGCGFVQTVTGGSNCSASSILPIKQKVNTAPDADMLKAGAGCGAPTFFSAPSDNKCGGLGGCAVPISASQMYPAPDPKQGNKMELFNFTQDAQGWHSESMQDAIEYNESELVYDVAWKAYVEVLTKRGAKIPEKPKPSELRIAFPPST